MLNLTRGETAYAVFVVVVMVTGGIVWLWAAGIGSGSHRYTPAEYTPGPGPWPQVTRTIDGTPTVVQPEDLDR